jgi:hypothetical protein
MALPDRDVAKAWLGKTVVDRDGAEIGACTAVFADDASGLPEWIRVDFAGVNVCVPAVDAVESGGQVGVAVSRVDMAGAPSVGGAEHLSEDEEALLYRHYGIEYSRTRSESLLPAGEAGPPSTGVGADAATVTAERAAASTASDDVGSPPQPESDVAVTRFGEEALATRGRRVVVLSALGGLGAVLAAWVRGRRLRKRRAPTPAERLVRGARAASVASGGRAAAGAGRRAAQLAATAGQWGAQRSATAGRIGAVSAGRAGRLAATAGSRATARAVDVGKSGLRSGQRLGETVESVPEVVAERSERLQQRWRRRVGRLTTALAFGTGYVLGSRAGRERFEQLKGAAAKLAQRPELQQAGDRLKTVAADKLRTGTGRVTQPTTGVATRLRRRRAGAGTGTLAYPPPGPGMAAGSPSGPAGMPQPSGTAPDVVAAEDPGADSAR